MNEKKCAGKVWGAYRDVSGRVYSCSRPATVQRGGKWYCWQHDPERVKAKEQERRAKWGAETKKRTARRVRNAAEYYVCQGVSTEALEELGQGGLKRLLEKLGETPCPAG